MAEQERLFGDIFIWFYAFILGALCWLIYHLFVHPSPTPTLIRPIKVVPIFITSPRCVACGKLDKLHVCTGCRLVLYCSKKCQKTHWSVHRQDCNSPLLKNSWRPSFERDHRFPRFAHGVGEHISTIVDHIDRGIPLPSTVRDPMVNYSEYDCSRHYVFGNFPAVDILHLPDHEGTQSEQTLKVLFAASGDLRNLIKSVNGLPDDTTTPIHFHINDRDLHLVSRNFLLLWMALSSNNHKATAECAIHFWYSAFIPKWCQVAIQAMAKPLLRDLDPLMEAAGRFLEAQGYSQQAVHELHNQLVDRAWQFPNATIRTKFTKLDWALLPVALYENPGLSTDEAVTVRNLAVQPLDHGKIDDLEETLTQLPPEWRLARQRYQERGVLLPFGQPTAGTEMVPNMSFFRDKRWPLDPLTDPLDGWNLAEILGQDTGGADHDIYAKFFYFVRDQFEKFITRVQSLNVNFELSHLDAEKLHFWYPDARFDRIDVSNLGDGTFLNNDNTLDTVGRLLQPVSINPHATLVSLHLSVTTMLTAPCDCLTCAPIHKAAVIEATGELSLDDHEQLKAYFPAQEAGLCVADRVRRSLFWEIVRARFLVKNPEKAWELYKGINRFDQSAADRGMRMKQRNTIVDEWPLRLKLTGRFTEDGRATADSQREFDLLRASGHDGTPRFVEWQKAEETDAAERVLVDNPRAVHYHVENWLAHLAFDLA